ncbi:MAG TPA: ATP-binding protein [Pseudoneobacillus sp.]|nr:ATP-binding protein [Pseudoneobacillus sp.]
MEITKHLFSNLTIFIIFLFFSLVLIEKNRKTHLTKYLYIILFVLILWTCIQFSYNPVPSARFDLRVIPYVIGSLYLGMAPLLAAIIVILRGFYGIDTGFFLTIILYIPLSFMLWRFNPRFQSQLPKRRILFSVGLGIILGAITVAGMEIINTPNYWFDAWFAYLIIPPLGIGIISYCIEFVQSNIEMRHQLIKAEKLQAVEQMGAAISHEIRNPLTAASGFVQLLQDGYLTKQQQMDYLTIVKEELKAAERVIEDYLTFAKPSLVTIEELNVKKELQQVINILQPIANQNSVKISTDFSVVGFIQGDRQKFRQVFINVLKNAVESMPTGGYLTIGTEFSRNHITIQVNDTGIGMAKDQLERLGEPYYSTKGSKGTGLGMMVVYSIVRAMNGTIKVESEVGVGTTFHFKFPTQKLSMENLKKEK